MESLSNTPLTVTKALEVAKEHQPGQVPPAAATLLERHISDIWPRIQAHPTTYVMTKEQFAVFNYYRSRYDNNAVAQQAVTRFWNNSRSDEPEAVGVESSAESSSAIPS